MKRLIEWDTGDDFGPCSEKWEKEYEAALSRGRPFFMYPYHGYHLKMWVNKTAEASTPAVPSS